MKTDGGDVLSARLIKMIEDHAEELTGSLLTNLQSNPRTKGYHKLSVNEVHHRVYSVYRNLGEWLGNKTDESIEAHYTELGVKRRAEGIPLSEVIYALILTKYHLRDYISSSGLVDSAVEMYQETELHRRVGNFFDKAIFYTAKGYESVAASSRSTPAPSRAY